MARPAEHLDSAPGANESRAGKVDHTDFRGGSPSSVKNFSPTRAWKTIGTETVPRPRRKKAVNDALTFLDGRPGDIPPPFPEEGTEGDVGVYWDSRHAQVFAEVTFEGDGTCAYFAVRGVPGAVVEKYGNEGRGCGRPLARRPAANSANSKLRLRPLSSCRAPVWTSRRSMAKGNASALATASGFPDCACENESVSKYSPGTVVDSEILVRTLFRGQQIGPDGRLKPAYFRPDPATRGFSVDRVTLMGFRDFEVDQVYRRTIQRLFAVHRNLHTRCSRIAGRRKTTILYLRFGHCRE